MQYVVVVMIVVMLVGIGVGLACGALSLVLFAVDRLRTFPSRVHASHNTSTVRY